VDDVQEKEKILGTERAITNSQSEGLGYAVAQLVEALCYKQKGRGFDSR
jgi:hypothetical protein